MYVVHHAHLPHETLDGERRVPALAPGGEHTGFEVQVRVLDAGAHTRAQRHTGALVVIALTGAGKLLVDGGPQRFMGPCTLAIPAGVAFEVFNLTPAPLEMVWVFTRAPIAA